MMVCHVELKRIFEKHPQNQEFHFASQSGRRKQQVKIYSIVCSFRLLNQSRSGWDLGQLGIRYNLISREAQTENR